MTGFRSELNKNEIRLLDLASEKGASIRLNALPLMRYHFDLTKSEFRDGIALRNCWYTVKMPSPFAFNENFTEAHALKFPKRGYTHMRHNELTDSFGNLFCDVCHDVEIEPHIQPLQWETFAPNQRQLMMMLD